MSYAMPFGTVIIPTPKASAKPCGKNGFRSELDGDCYCNIGHDWTHPDDDDDYDCSPVTSCPPAEGRRLSPVSKECQCPPGMSVNRQPDRFDCVPNPGGWFPDCVDAHGRRIEGCLLGRPTHEIVKPVLVGLAAGTVLGVVLFKLLA